MDKNTREVMFSSASDEWETPRWLYDRLNEIFHFTLDPAASDISHMCDNYYTKEDDGLSKSWLGEVVFINPPYSKIGGKSQAAQWCQKAVYEYRAPVVILLPARTDTKMWHNYVFPGATHALFLEGRLKFVNRLSDKKPTSAPFASAVIVYRGYNYKLSGLKDLGYLVTL